jgi:hypothetical protein
MMHLAQYCAGYERGHADCTNNLGWAAKPYEGPSRQLSIHFIDGYRCGYLDAQNDSATVDEA